MIHKRLAKAGSDGLTLVEMMIAMAIALIVMSLVFTSMMVVVRISGDSIATNHENQALDLAMVKIQAQVQSANLVFNPTLEGNRAGTVPPGFSVRIVSVTKETSGVCDQWRVTAQQLELRSWKGTPGAAPHTVTPWVAVVNGVVNPTTSPPFALTPTPNYDHRVLRVDLSVHTGAKDAPSTTVHTSFDDTDAQFFSPTDTQFCTPVPPV